MKKLIVLSAAAGAGLAYFLDPELGDPRRRRVRERVLAACRGMAARCGCGRAGAAAAGDEQAAPDPVTEAALESFPASDAPSWNP